MSFSFLQRWKWSKRMYFGDYSYQDMEKRDKKTGFCKQILDPKEWICQKNLIFFFFTNYIFHVLLRFLKVLAKNFFFFFLQIFSKHCEISNCSTIWKKWCFGWKQKWNITTTPRWGVSTLKMETLRFFLQSRKNFIIKKQLEISFFYANFLFIFLKKSRKNSEKNTQIGLAYTVWGPSILGYPICTYF